MMEPTRNEILDRLALLSELAPDMRFGQLIANLTFLAAGPWDENLWDLEDGQLIGAIRQMEFDLAQREGAPLTDAQKQDLQSRLAAYEANPQGGSSWEEVKTHLQGKP